MKARQSSSTRMIALGGKLAVFVWPRRGLRRAWTFQLLRLSRLKVSPHKISLGFAAGAFASFLPLIGLHFALAATLAWVFRGSIIASAVGTVVGNPITFPFIWYATYKVGVVFTGLTSSSDRGPLITSPELQLGLSGQSLSNYWGTFGEAFWPMLVGAMPLGLACALVCYLAVYKSVQGVRRASRSTRTQQRSRDLAAHSS